MTDRIPEKLWVAFVLSLSVGIAIWIHFSSAIFRLGQTWEEDALFQIVARNISFRGALTDLFLDNYALGQDPAAHPFYYTHFPTLAGILQWTVGVFGGGLGASKSFVIGLFAVGQVYCYLFLRRLFPPAVAIIAFTLSALNFSGTIVWSDNTVHGVHWLVTFGALYHFDSYLAQKTDALRSRHLYFAIFFFSLALFTTLIHVLVIGIAALYLCSQYNFREKFFGKAAFLATPMICMLLHSARVAYLIGLDNFIYDLFHNMAKAASSFTVEQLVDAYRQLGIIVWPTDFPGQGRVDLYRKILDFTLLEIGTIGTVLICVTTLLGLVAMAFRLMPSDSNMRLKCTSSSIDAFAPAPFLAGGLIVWAVIFPVHTANYFSATPRILISFYAALSAALLVHLISLRLINFRAKLPRFGFRAAVIVIGFWIGSTWANGYETAKFTPVPGISVLPEYRGKTFYTNSWPFLVSYYTHEWAIGGLSPPDAAKRNYLKARYLLQRDYSNSEKYSRPDYYFWISNMQFAPFSDIDPKSDDFKLVQEGEGWRIYKICPCGTDQP